MFQKISYIFTRKQKIHLFFLLIIITIGAFFELLGVSAILPLVNVVTDVDIINQKWYFIFLQNTLNIHEAREFVLFLSILLILIYIVKNMFLIMMYDMQYRFTNNNQRILASKLMNTYVNQEYLFHVSHNVAELQRNITNDVAQFFSVVLNFLQLLTEATVCITLGIYLLLTDITTTLIVALLLGVFLSIFAIVYKRKLGALGKENREVNATTTKWLLQTFGGIKEIKVFNKEFFFLKHFDESYKRYAMIQRQQSLLSAIPKPIMESICICGLLFTMSIQIYFGSEEQIGSFVPVLSVFAVAAFRMLPSFNRITAYVSAIMYSRASVNAVYDDLKQLEGMDLVEVSCDDGDLKMQIEKEIRIEHVTFSYPNTDRNVLEDINITIQKNQSIAFVGTSGAGKSTLADIILGVLKPCDGCIKADGVDIRDKMGAWHHMIGYIPQSIYLMDDSIKKNIAFGIDEAEIDDQRIREVIQEAQLEEFITELENGLDTQVGDRGVRLSGGQRQRIGIARALYHNPQLLVLDEATSALDGDTELAVMDAINMLQGNKTIIIIAHRISTIRKCDKIYEVGNSTVIEKNKTELFENK